MKKILLVSLLSGLFFSGNITLAETAANWIAVHNLSENVVTYSQFPDDFGTVLIYPGETVKMGEEISHAPVYQVYLCPPNPKECVELEVVPGTIIDWRDGNKYERR